MPAVVEATVKFADLVDGIAKLAAVVVVAYALVRLVPAMREHGFTTTMFGVNVKVNGSSEAVEKLSANVGKQIDDLRNQITALSAGTAGAPSRSAAAARPRITGDRRVLWVDDHPDNNLFEVGKLRKEEVDVTTVTSTGDAMKALQQDHFDVVITDMVRREGLRDVRNAGVRLIEKMRAKGTDQTPVFVYCSAEDAVGKPAQDAMDAGATAVTASTTTLLQDLAETLSG
jgi:CheY-like chemotaxis protein